MCDISSYLQSNIYKRGGGDRYGCQITTLIIFMNDMSWSTNESWLKIYPRREMSLF